VPKEVRWSHPQAKAKQPSIGKLIDEAMAAIEVALVSCPIALHAACSTAERIAFRQISKATGNRLRQQLIDEETREPVAPEDKGRGYEGRQGSVPHGR
jgi:hypothetical protein